MLGGVEICSADLRLQSVVFRFGYTQSKLKTPRRSARIYRRKVSEWHQVPIGGISSYRQRNRHDATAEMKILFATVPELVRLCCGYEKGLVPVLLNRQIIKVQNFLRSVSQYVVLTPLLHQAL